MARVTESQRERLRRMDLLELERNTYRAALEQIADLPCVRDLVRPEADGRITVLHCFPDTAEGPYDVARAALKQGGVWRTT